jgi:DNA-binding NarL/FixJ family response regulator
MQDVNGVVTLSQRAVPRIGGHGAKPSLRCAVVIETLPLFAEGLVRLLQGLADIRMISTCATSANLRTLLARLRPELVILDLDAHDTRPIDAVRLVQRHTRGAKLIFLSAAFSPQTVPMLMRAGASAILLKSARPADLRETVLRVLRTRTARQSAARSPARIEASASEPPPLTQREREILTYVALGFSVKRTADTLGLSPKTIESHRTRLMAKLHIHDRVMLTHYALQLGIVPQMSTSVALSDAESGALIEPPSARSEGEMADDMITRVVEGVNPAARLALLNLLAEAENTWANFDVVCHEPQRCQTVLSFSHLFALRRRLEESLATAPAGGLKPGSTPRKEV